jgi:hypothetical protein
MKLCLIPEGEFNKNSGVVYKERLKWTNLIKLILPSLFVSSHTMMYWSSDLLFNLCDVPEEESSAEWDILCEASSEIESGARSLSAFP